MEIPFGLKPSSHAQPNADRPWGLEVTKETSGSAFGMKHSLSQNNADRSWGLAGTKESRDSALGVKHSSHAQNNADRSSDRSWGLAGTVESRGSEGEVLGGYEVDIDLGFHQRALTKYNNQISSNGVSGAPMRLSALQMRRSRLSSLASGEGRNSILLFRRMSVGVGSIGSLSSHSTNRSFTGNIMKASESTFAGQGDEELFRQLEGDFEQALEFLRNDMVGRNRLLEGPFGPRVKVYLDYTAAGQGLHSINKYMAWLKEHFANTHTEDSATGRFMTSAFDDAIKSIETCVNAKGKFVAICTGTGSTGALLRLQQILGIYIPPSAWRQLELLTCKGKSEPDSKERISLASIPNASIKTEKTLPFPGECPVWWRARERVKAAIRAQGRLPLVFVGGFEHHSNELTWRHGLCDVIRVPLTKSFELDLEELEKLLQYHRNATPNRPIIGSFSACSNVTGMHADLFAISKLLRAVQGKFFIDYAASGPYADIDCFPEGVPDLFDGFVLSPHKFLGGDGSCGLLMLRKSIYDTRLPPTFAGGGTVKFVGRSYHAFSDDIVERENAGTPGALQIYQCALAFEVKELVGPASIAVRETELLDNFFGWIKDTHPDEICILGNQDPKLRTPIIAFNIVAPHPLHPRYVTVLLSDLFGIQTRAGCSCAGPHGWDLLVGEHAEMELQFFSIMVGEPRGFKVEDAPDPQDLFSMKPGWCRLNLHYTMDDDEMWYLKEVLSFVVTHGGKFLSLYSFDMCSGSWEFKPPEAIRKAISPANKDGEHQFGLQAAYGCQHSRKLIDTLQKSGSRRQLLEAQLRDANKLLKHLPKYPRLAPPPAPFPEINLPALGPQPYFVVADGQMHNIEKLERKMNEFHIGQNVPAPKESKKFKQTVDPILEVEVSTDYFIPDSKVEEITLSWSTLCYAVKQRHGMKDILRSCSGVARSGQVLCILGASGAGKTSLLDALSDRIRPGRNRKLDGEILVNGYPRDSSFRFLRSHVPKKHNLFWMFTVRETLWQAAHLVMPRSTPTASKRDKIQSVIRALGLDGCADTKVGLPFVFRGLSGGQLKRLSIAVELLSDPSLLICDEPTSSLDWKEAEQVTLCLSKIARAKNITVISSIHQPSTRIWEAMDQVCLLTGGRVAYFGARVDAVSFFSLYGLACPQYSNPPDFFVEVLDMDFHNYVDKSDALEPLFKACKKGIAAQRDALDFVAADQVGAKYCANNGFIQAAILLRRFFMKNVKDPSIFWVRLVMYSALAVIVALLHYGIGDERNEESVNSRLALNFYAATFFVFIAIAAVPQLMEDRGVFTRERSNGYYGTLPYCIANYLAILPVLFVITVVTGAIIVPSTGITSFRKYCFMMFPSLAVAEGIVNVFSSMAPHYIVSSALIAGLNGGFMLVQVKSHIPDYLIWMHHSAYHTYVFRLAMTATFKELDTIGADVLKMYDMDTVDETADFIVLISYAFGLQFIFYLLMSWLHDGRH